MDKYVKVKKIGEGSFGKALLVRSKSNGKQMVVKEINMSKMKSKEREEARKEVSVLAQLDHPNIVAYKESFEEVGNLYIVMDYCDGGDLYGKINQQKGALFKEDQVVDWFVQICLAMKHIHDRKILHRDIKSQNIFLTRHGIVKLGDFGIAKVLNSTVELARTCIGTPYYLSPEICENKPYNNKSDIWSLGCVLYELATLKHAFEAGCMKNLVLKIIRGSYPPPPPCYSYDLRSLINALFKRSPRDRPSINSVLKKPLLQARIRKFLSENEVQEEFSHTVMHGVKLQKQLPPGGARPLPPKPQIAKRAPSPSQAKYNPASVYGPSVARKSAGKERKSAEIRKSGGNVKRATPSPTPAVGNHVADLQKRRQELVEKERKRRVEAKKREDIQRNQAYAKRHQELVDKQKVGRQQKAKEEGWKNLIDSLSSEDSEKSGGIRKKDDTPKFDPAAGNDRGNYEQYHDFLDKIQKERNNGAQLGVAGALGYGAGGGGGGGGGGAVYAAKQGAAAGARGAEAAKIAGDFWDRKREAAINRARALGDMYGGAGAALSPRIAPRVPSPSPSPSPSPGGRVPAPGSKESHISKPPSGRPVSGRDRREEEYLDHLKQIRLQNFNERRNIKNRVAGKADPKYKPPSDLKSEAEIRRKKIEALKAQADERARKLKEDLEKRRKEAYAFEQRRLKMQGKQKNPEKAPKPAAPSKPIGLTEALEGIGVIKETPKEPVPQLEKCPIGMTAAMAAIGVTPQSTDEEGKSPLQKKKDSILKKLNSKPPVASKPERSKWGEPVKPPAERSKWASAEAGPSLRAKSLEETGSHMDATSAGDVVVKHVDFQNQPSSPADADTRSESGAGARRQWGGQAGTVLNVLGQAELLEDGTFTATDVLPEITRGEQPEIAKDKQPADDKPGTKAPAIGSTITIGRCAGERTVVIKKADVAQPQDDEKDGKPAERSSADVEMKEERSHPPSPVSEPVSEEKPGLSPGAEVSSPLFDRVELEENDDEEKGHEKDLEVVDYVEEKEEIEKSSAIEEVDEESNLTKMSKSMKIPGTIKDANLVLGVTTGHFDADVKLLRTCSEPNLSKTSRTELTEEQSSKEKNCLNLSDIEDLLKDNDNESDKNSASPDDTGDKSSENEGNEAEELLDDQETRGIEPYEPDFKGLSGDEETPGETEEAEDEAQEDSDDEGGSGDTDEEDLETMRESMMGLLLTEDAKEDEEPLTARSSKKKVKKLPPKKKKIKKKKTKDAENTSKSMPRPWSASSVKDLNTMKETMKTLLQPATEKQPKKLKPISEVGGGDAMSKEDISTIIPGTESWQSDDDEGDDDYFEEEDMFSRLEASRAKLEQELGCDVFLKAYKTVQDSCKMTAIHEDEDENMEEGILLVSGILGHDKIHLYPSILQLVMADGVFTEDND